MDTLKSLKNKIVANDLFKVTAITHIAYIIVIIVLIIALICKCNYPIQGIWTADGSFLDEANLKSMTLYIGDKVGFCKYLGYMYVESNEGILEDRAVTFKLHRTFCLNTYKGHIENSTLWTEKMTFRFCPKKNCMTIIRGKTVYGELFKDTILTDFAQTTNSSSLDQVADAVSSTISSDIDSSSDTESISSE